MKAKEKRKVNWVSKIIILIVGAAVLAGLFFIGKAGLVEPITATRIGYKGNETWSDWSGLYYKLDGTMKRSISPNGDTAVLTVRTEEGSLQIQLRDKNDEIFFDETYDGDDLGDKTTEIPVDGKFHVTIIAAEHKGGFDVNA